MLRQTRTLTVLLFAAIVCIATLAYAAPTQSGAKKAKRSSKKTVAAQTAPQPAPEPPKTPAQLPPVPPTVTYTNGQLSIDAPNSTLSDVLAGVKRATGANIEGGGGERIVAHLGPGKPRDVLTSLLRNSRYDFIILAPKGDPTGLQRVMLMARAGSEHTSSAPTSGFAPTAQGGSQPTPQVANTNPDDDGQDAEEDVSPKGPMTAEPEGPGPQPTPEQPGPQPQPNIAPQEAPQQNSGGDQQQGPPVKTPEQLFRELQQLQQQQQQQQQPQQQR